MNKLIKIVIILSIALMAPNAKSYAMYSKAGITIKVVGENDRAVEGARVGIGFNDHRTSSYENTVIGVTDKQGLFTGSETTPSGLLGFNVTKDGYYMSIGKYQFQSKSLLRWEPWNPEVKVVLRKIENPVPMYARDTVRSIIEIPVIGKDVGFDLMVFDWVAPYGLGSKADFIFHLERLPVITRGNYDARLDITFSNKFDGIQTFRENLSNGSRLKLPKQAPLEGYMQKIILHESFNASTQPKLNFEFRADNLNYIFRVRSEIKDGKFERGMYGKIRGVIDFSAMRTKTAKIYLYYYLNPDYTRNLEFDPNRNLLGNLPSLERVTEP